MTNTRTSPLRRVALIADASSYVGPDLARLMAARDHDLVLGNPSADLVHELEAAGAAVEAVEGTHDLAQPEAAPTLLQAALDRFGRVDSATAASGRIVVGRFVNSTIEDFRAVFEGCMEAPFRFLRTMVPHMIDQGGGQLLVITSASSVRPTPGAPLYSSARAGANMLVRNVAAEVADTGVQVNAVGTNFMDFPAFLKASRADNPEGRSRVEAQVPMGRLGTMTEFAHFCLPYIDGTSGFTTGQFVAYAGGWA
jgi:NAD(P)-dependent dehydrogenase (short-subunit alcohol dehydrogenase family)